MKNTFRLFNLILFITASTYIQAQEEIEAMDIFDLKYVSNVQIAPNGQKIAYLVNHKDIITDTSYSNLWIMNTDGSNKQQITKGNFHDYGASWSNKLRQYTADRFAVFYEIVRKIDDHTKITVDSIQGIANQNPMLVPKVYFSTEEMNCSCQFRISKYGKRDWIVVDQQPRAKCRKKTLVTNK